MKKKRQKDSTRKLLGIHGITQYGLETDHGLLVFFTVKPDNIAVLSAESIRAKIYALMTILKGVTEVEFLCLNSRENFEGNKRYLKSRLQEEQNVSIRRLLEKDLHFLDQIQIQMATAREFMILIRMASQFHEKEIYSHLSRIETILREQGFTISRAGEQDIKRLLGIYYEQNVIQEQFEDYDGERWIIEPDKE